MSKKKDTKTSDKPSVRAFVAIELPEEVKRFLGRWTERLKRCGAPVRWTKPAAMHLTLKFMGDTAEELLPRVDELLTEAVKDCECLPLAVKGFGTFPERGKPRIVWAGIDDYSDGLPNLVSHIETALEPEGFPREKRPYTAHLTIGRVKSPKDCNELVETLKHGSEEAGPSFEAEEAVLFQSILHASGAEYKPLRRFAFKKPSPS